MDGKQQLLNWTQRVSRAAVPPRLHAWWRARRVLRRGEPELKLLPFLVPRDRTALDIGANKGSYTYFLSRLCPQVIAYEPNPAMRSLLTERMPPNVTVLPFAASNAAGQAELVIPKNRQGCRNNVGTLNAGRFEGDVVRVSVETVRLDDQSLQNIGFIKIDVEGHELQVLEGCQQILLRDHPVLLVEIIEQHTGRPWQESVSRFTQLGYSAFVMSGGRLETVEQFLIENPPATVQFPRNVIFLPKP